MIVAHPTADELPFVYSATKKSLRHSEEFAQRSNFEAYGRINPMVNADLAKADILVAREGGKVLGFIAYEPSAAVLRVVFLYVKHDHRRSGIGKQLLLEALEEVPATAELLYTYPTRRFEKLAERYDFWREGT